MKQSKKCRFVVEGANPFPLDMLRYDRCWPEQSREMSNVADSFNDATAHIGKFKVHLASERPGGPTRGRWESYGWKVIAVQIGCTL